MQITPEQILQEAAANLKDRSPGMSLRAVAGRLNISPSYWSKILRGQRPLPENLLPRVVKVLSMDTHQTARLQRTILQTIEERKLAPVTGVHTKRDTSPVDEFKTLKQEDYWLLEEWYLIPILNLFTVSGFSQTTEEIARRLGISKDTAANAVSRLSLKGYLKENGTTLERTDMQVRFPTDRSHSSIRKFHQEMITKARKELDAPAAFDSRLISALNFTGSSAKLNEARLILEEAMYRAAKLMAEEEVTDEVYQLNLQIFPLTKR